MGVCPDGEFKKVYTSYVTQLQRYVIARGHALEDACDIVQDAFIRLWNNCDKVEKSTVKSYLYTIVGNLLIDKYRKKSIKLVEKKVEHDLPNRETPHYELEHSEFKDKFEQFINDMKEGPREVFLLYRMEGMNYKEIAQHLDLSVKAVEKRMQIALKALHDAKFLTKR